MYLMFLSKHGCTRIGGTCLHWAVCFWVRCPMDRDLFANFLLYGLACILWDSLTSQGFDRNECIELTLSRRNNKNSSQSFICRILMAEHSVKIMAEIQRRIRFNTISMSVLMITIAVGVMTAMWMYADSIVWFKNCQGVSFLVCKLLNFRFLSNPVWK